ncbi:MAG TPA: 30S ribosomal protein S5 [Candidatus Norongarragalinales archaeon]|jgi:small subunit ribosomal protein S5|nr:30S ribosomal protein S5 [Candidatus Norongarragalinales archaeon]
MARDFRERERQQVEWTPRTELGRRVASGEVTSLDQIFDQGQRVLETEIIDVLLPDLKDEVLEISNTQRMSASGRKQKKKAVTIIGNRHGYISVGVGKAPEARDAVASSIVEGKKHLVRVPLGCGSWECRCGTQHSISQTAFGRNGTAEITLKPAPRGVGIVAGTVARKVLELAGVRDVWTFTKGRTRNPLNMALATIKAIDSLNRLKRGTKQEIATTATETVQS